jgi:hypothetical protein
VARSFARIITAIWRNTEFRALHSGAQRVYLLLVTQPNISAAGTLPLTVRRWAEMSPDTTVQQINRELDALVRGRFIGVDASTEEVLVRSFVRWDGGYGNRKRRPVILAAADELVSPALRAMLSAEFARLSIPFAAASQTPVTEQEDGDHVESYSQVDSLSDSASDSYPDGTTPFDRVVGCEGEYVGTTTHNPQPIPPSAAGGAADPVDAKKAANKAAQELTRVYTDVVKLSNFPAVMAIVKKARGTGQYADEQIRAALERLAADGRSVTTDALRYELEGFPAARPAPNPTDAGIQALMRPTVPTLRALPGGAP